MPQRVILSPLGGSTAKPVEAGPRRYRGRIVGMQWIKPVDRRKVMEECGLNGGIQTYQTVKDEVFVAFLRSVYALVPQADRQRGRSHAATAMARERFDISPRGRPRVGRGLHAGPCGH